MTDVQRPVPEERRRPEGRATDAKAVAEVQKPLPVPDQDTRPFWEACREHELRAQRCTSCGRFRWPPQSFCPGCYSWEYEWTLLPGTGRVKSFSVVHHSAVPPFQSELPYVVAVIELDGTGGHVNLMSNVVGCPWEDVAVGMGVQVVFNDLSSEISLPQFRPRDKLPR